MCFLHVSWSTFPFFDLQVSTLKALVQRLGHRFVVWIMVLSEIGVSQSFSSCYSLIRVQNQHFLEEVDSLKRTGHLICEPLTVVQRWTLSSRDILMWILLLKKPHRHIFWTETSNCKCLFLLPCGLAPRKTSAKFLLGMHGRELM